MRMKDPEECIDGATPPQSCIDGDTYQAERSEYERWQPQPPKKENCDAAHKLTRLPFHPPRARAGRVGTEPPGESGKYTGGTGVTRRQLVTDRLEILIGLIARPARRKTTKKSLALQSACPRRHCAPASVLITCLSSFKGGPCAFLSNLWNADCEWSC